MKYFLLTIVLVISSFVSVSASQSEFSIISVSADGSQVTVTLNKIKKLMFGKSASGSVILAHNRNGQIVSGDARKIYFRNIPVKEPEDTVVVPPIDTTIVPPVDTTIVPPADTTIVPPVDTTIVPPADTTIVPPVDTTIVPPADTTIVPEVNPQDTVIVPVTPDVEPENPTEPEFKYEGPVVAYPNPVSDYLTILGIEEDTVVRIYNLNGRLCLESKGRKVDVSRLLKGSYLLRVKDCDMMFIKK
ncbi:MAG: T9SS type A sorting domain-containing protein [Paludibacteraceae bacterium]|nr:T9SS type A sorting domain-containing protein [Paludibacteraceae bacterium]